MQSQEEKMQNQDGDSQELSNLDELLKDQVLPPNFYF